MAENLGFAITRHTGFQLKLPNGYTVSVQFGPWNYCAGYPAIGNWDAPVKSDFWTSPNAEIAAWDSDGTWYEFENDSVKGWCDVAEVIEFVSMISARTEPLPKKAGKI